MLSFQTYLEEKVDNPDVILHMEHIEDIMWDAGIDGIRDSINYLLGLLKMLSPNLNEAHSLSLQWKVDGSMSLFCGINPENGKFFVATKGLFANNSKINYTNEDIDRNHPAEGLRQKLKTALRYLPELGLDGVYQGDVMFTPEMFTQEMMGGEKCLVFTPNTITYAIPIDTPLAQEMKRSKIGIIMHTKYTGTSIKTLKASFGVNTNAFRKTPNVWCSDPSIRDITPAMLSYEEVNKISELLSNAGRLFRNISPRVANTISSSETYKIQLKTWNNTTVRRGTNISNAGMNMFEFIRNIADKYNTSINAASKPETKRKRTLERDVVLRFYRSNAGQIKSMYEIWMLLSQAKEILIRKLNALVSWGTFYKSGDGYITADPEGFVAIRMDNQRAVKFVSRLNFSRQNFMTNQGKLRR